YTSGPGIRY
nr:Chain C, peptide of Protein Nef [synthetic construct]3JTT_F Chain F, peptide of Protein Nef [synthetic construct]3JTT_I Chain I, peptide of Protein Nef [synthetic construct]